MTGTAGARARPPTLTIAIPTVNRVSLVKAAIASALAQTVPVEIIVSDNGSSDGTAGYLGSLALPGHVRLFRHDQTMPVQRHAAFLSSQVRTDWVVFLSDDDTVEPGFAAGCEALMVERPDVAMIYTGCKIYYGDVGVPAVVGPRLEEAPDFLFAFMRGQRNICMCATAFRIGDIRRFDPIPDDRIIGDMYYWTNILRHGGVIGCVDQHLSNYFFYRPGMTGETSRSNVVAWARESRILADGIATTIKTSAPSRYSDVQVARVVRKFMALTTSNQFAWNALRGAPRLALLNAFMIVGPIVLAYLMAPARAVGAIILPRSVLERRILTHARQLAERAAGAA